LASTCVYATEDICDPAFVACGVDRDCELVVENVRTLSRLKKRAVRVGCEHALLSILIGGRKLLDVKKQSFVVIIVLDEGEYGVESLDAVDNLILARAVEALSLSQEEKRDWVSSQHTVDKSLLLFQRPDQFALVFAVDKQIAFSEVSVHCLYALPLWNHSHLNPPS
jgi:hypothetical protein